MHWNVGNIHEKTNKHKQMLYLRFNLYKLVVWRNCHAVPALYVPYISMYIISGFHNSLKAVQLATLWTHHLRTVQYKSSQQFRLTPHTEHRCVLFCDYSEVQAKYRLNISLHFNPQPTPFFTIKYSFGFLPCKSTKPWTKNINNLHMESNVHFSVMLHPLPSVMCFVRLLISSDTTMQ